MTESDKKWIKEVINELIEQLKKFSPYNEQSNQKKLSKVVCRQCGRNVRSSWKSGVKHDMCSHCRAIAETPHCTVCHGMIRNIDDNFPGLCASCRSVRKNGEFKIETPDDATVTFGPTIPDTPKESCRPRPERTVVVAETDKAVAEKTPKRAPVAAGDFVREWQRCRSHAEAREKLGPNAAQRASVLRGKGVVLKKFPQENRGGQKKLNVDELNKVAKKEEEIVTKIGFGG